MSIDFQQARFAMVEQQVRPWDVLDPRVLETLMTVPREDYVPPRHRKLAFADLALPLEHGESMMKPVIEGRMLQALALQPEDQVLEIGTGSGFVTACLARLAHEVTSVDIHADFVERAQARLVADGHLNVRLETADALAWEPGRLFDAIAVTGAVADRPERFAAWLRPGGRLFVVHGHSPVQEALLLTREGEGLLRESLFETDIPYLRGAEPAPRFIL
ncbi:protein-L-isoaspartate O-methyltransferase family protein [Arenimonas fontis]|uniref:Protein-L-isoaspartate O-methyltransferase n=1 Tax=Arenimonas fontis TaxID=2608255 RepID=A0A5B2Z6B3_9GAMM|nr:protein-L-isoaspartate O-methyltransferase [Arenimonas fontis]KAA2284368.1 protein-L-isoaspartate O-methyltransferase [Arenimonas fontis]